MSQPSTSQGLQGRLTYVKGALVVLIVTMLAACAGFTVYKVKLKGKADNASILAARLSRSATASSAQVPTGSARPEKEKSGKREQGSESSARSPEGSSGGGSARPDLPEDFTSLLNTHPLFGAAPKSGPPQANLQGILGDQALINGKWIKVGETQDGVKLVQTMVGKVLVEIEGKQREVSVFSDLPYSEPKPNQQVQAMMAGNFSGGDGGSGRRSEYSSGRGSRGFRGGNFSASGNYGGGMSAKDIATIKKLEKRFGGDMNSIPEPVRKQYLGNYNSIGEAYAAYKRGELKLPIPQDQVDAQVEKFINSGNFDDGSHGPVSKRGSDGMMGGKKGKKKGRNFDGGGPDFGGGGMPNISPERLRNMPPDVLERLRNRQRSSDGGPRPDTGFIPKSSSGGSSGMPGGPSSERKIRRSMDGGSSSFAPPSAASGSSKIPKKSLDRPPTGSSSNGGASERPSLRSRILDRSSSRQGRSDSGGPSSLSSRSSSDSHNHGPSSDSRRRPDSSSGSKPSVGKSSPDGGSSSSIVKKKRPDAPGALGSSSLPKATSVSGKAGSTKSTGGSNANGSDENHTKSRKAKNPYRN